MDDIFSSSFPGSEVVLPIYTILRALVIAFDIVLLIGFIYAFKKLWKFRPKLKHEKSKRLITLRNAYFRDRWKKIVQRYKANPNADSVKIAIIEADKLIDEVLRDLKFPGKTLADRLSYLNNRDIKSLDGLWDAHRVRNEVSHSIGLHLTGAQGARTLKKYEAFLKELSII